MPYTYRDQPVHIPKFAEVSAAFRAPNGIFSNVVQAALDEVEPWEVGEDPIESFPLPRKIGARAVLLAAGEKPVWGVNPHHKARRPGLSPFIQLDSSDNRYTTDVATLELTGTVTEPLLTRVYPGDYMPPLPWMMSAAKALDGRDTCLRYWNSHAFIMRAAYPPRDLTDTPPDWYTGPVEQ